MLFRDEQKAKASKIFLPNKRRTDKFFAGKKIIIETKDKQLTETKKINRGQKTATRA